MGDRWCSKSTQVVNKISSNYTDFSVTYFYHCQQRGVIFVCIFLIYYLTKISNVPLLTIPKLRCVYDNSRILVCRRTSSCPQKKNNNKIKTAPLIYPEEDKDKFQASNSHFSWLCLFVLHWWLLMSRLCHYTEVNINIK